MDLRHGPTAQLCWLFLLAHSHNKPDFVNELEYHPPCCYRLSWCRFPCQSKIRWYVDYALCNLYASFTFSSFPFSSSSSPPSSLSSSSPPSPSQLKGCISNPQTILIQPGLLLPPRLARRLPLTPEEILFCLLRVKNKRILEKLCVAHRGFLRYRSQFYAIS